MKRIHLHADDETLHTGFVNSWYLAIKLSSAVALMCHKSNFEINGTGSVSYRPACPIEIFFQVDILEM